MTSREWIELVTSLAWPIVGLLGLIYVWRSDAIGNLIKISDSVKGLRERLKELVEAEQRLSQSVGGITELTTTINDLHSELISMRADVESIRDKVDQKPENALEIDKSIKKNHVDLDDLFAEIDLAWKTLTDELDNKFGWFDRRSTGSEAYRFAHGNRKGPRLSYETADEIARLHSSIKSYRRRRYNLSDWLTSEIRDEFLKACTIAVKDIIAA